VNILKPHVSLNISNVDASVAFYEKVFGVSAIKRRPGYAKFDLQEPSLNLTMQEAPPAKTAAACCAPAALPAQDKPVQLGKKTGCC
jgi:catechol 2,3-dioxygenase-like lactoylglutathione lyase family enzyme